MADRMVHIADGFWNIRGSFKIGPLDIGTQASLVRLRSGKFVLLDAYTPDEKLTQELMALTQQGRELEAIIHLHPFHTVHVKRVAKMFPDAKLYGTSRHQAKAPGLHWESQLTDQPDFHELYEEDFAFTVPRGVAFIPEDEKLHFSSVLAHHRESKSLHVDDTLSYIPIPLVGGLRFHPTLKSVLLPEAGAASAFRAWVDELLELCQDVDRILTAHGKKLPPKPGKGKSAVDLVNRAFGLVEKVLQQHEKRYG